jgi:hypothetical protein
MPRQPFEAARKGFEAVAQRADSGLRIRREQTAALRPESCPHSSKMTGIENSLMTRAVSVLR